MVFSIVFPKTPFLFLDKWKRYNFEHVCFFPSCWSLEVYIEPSERLENVALHYERKCKKQRIVSWTEDIYREKIVRRNYFPWSHLSTGSVLDGFYLHMFSEFFSRLHIDYFNFLYLMLKECSPTNPLEFNSLTSYVKRGAYVILNW